MIILIKSLQFYCYFFRKSCVLNNEPKIERVNKTEEEYSNRTNEQ